MSEFSDHTINFNNFVNKNSFFKNEERKNLLLSIDKNSLFLKRIIELKKSERSSSHKLVCNANGNYEVLSNKSNPKIYKNPKYFKKLLIETKAEYPKRGYPKFSINLKKLSSQKDNNSYLTDKSKVNYSTNFQNLNNTDKSNFSINKTQRYDCNTESRVLIFKGRKMFSPLLFYENNNNTFNTIDNSTKLKENKSELYRNYYELNLKKEEIYKRKIKKNSSADNRNILKIQKDKEIKLQTIQNIKHSYKTKKIESLNRIKKIPKGNNNHKLKNRKKNNNKIDNYIVSKDNKKHDLKRNELYQSYKNNLTNLNKTTIVKKNKNICFKNVISITNNRKNNSQINNNNFNNNCIENKENYSQNYFNINKKLNSNISFFQNKSTSFVIDTNTKFSKKYLIENSDNESYFYTKDKKLTIKIHTIKYLNQFFPKRNVEHLILSIQRFEIFISKIKLMNKYKYNSNAFKIKEACKKKIIA